VMKPPEESQEGFKLNFIIFSYGSFRLRSYPNSRSCNLILCCRL